MACCNTKTIIKAYKDVITGTKYEFTDDRVRICQACDRNKWWFKFLFCRECKCYIPAMARCKEKKCNLGKW